MKKDIKTMENERMRFEYNLFKILRGLLIASIFGLLFAIILSGVFNVPNINRPNCATALILVFLANFSVSGTLESLEKKIRDDIISENIYRKMKRDGVFSNCKNCDNKCWDDENDDENEEEISEEDCNYCDKCWITAHDAALEEENKEEE